MAMYDKEEEMDFSLTPAQLDIRKAAREFAEGEFPNLAKECDMDETFDLELLRKASQLGFIGVFIDEKYGGGGFGFLENAIVMEDFWRVDPGLVGRSQRYQQDWWHLFIEV